MLFLALLVAALTTPQQAASPVPAATPALASQCTHPPLPITEVGGRPVDASRYPYTFVRVSVDASGKLTGAQVLRSADDKSADDNALEALRLWAFAPAQADCKAVSGTLDITVGLDPKEGSGSQTFENPCFHDVEVVAAVPPDFPAAEAGKLQKNAVVLVKIDVDATGRLKSAGVFQSSGYPDIDDAALTAAKQSWLAPKVAFCTPVDGTYLFRSTFTP